MNQNSLTMPKLMIGRMPESFTPSDCTLTLEHEQILTELQKSKNYRTYCCNICGKTDHNSDKCPNSRFINIKEFVDNTQNELEEDCNFLRNQYCKNFSRDQYGLCKSEALKDPTWDNSCFCSNCSEQNHRWHECLYPPFGEIISTMNSDFNLSVYRNKFKKPMNSANPQ